jgi:hypothetical protein
LIDIREPEYPDNKDVKEGIRMPPILCRKDRHSSQEEMLQGRFYLQADRFAMEKWRLNLA